MGKNRNVELNVRGRMRKIYSVDFKKLIDFFVRIPLRTTVRMEWLSVLIAPIVRMYGEHILFCEKTKYNYTYVSQVGKLTKRLNDEFDQTLRRIRVVDACNYSYQYFYTNAESIPVYLPIYLSTREEFAYKDTDFNVVMNGCIVLELDYLINVVNRYKLISKKFNVV